MQLRAGCVVPLPVMAQGPERGDTAIASSLVWMNPEVAHRADRAALAIGVPPYWAVGNARTDRDICDSRRCWPCAFSKKPDFCGDSAWTTAKMRVFRPFLPPPPAALVRFQWKTSDF